MVYSCSVSEGRPIHAVFQKVTLPEDWSSDSAMLNYRMRHGQGLQQIRGQLSIHFGSLSPAGAPESPSGLSVATVNFATRAAAKMRAKPDSLESASPAVGQADEFARFTYLTQLQQLLIYQAAAQRWRRPAVEDQNPYRTMGLLYWQLNDIWQGPSWSGLDWGGGWKQLHYGARRFFSPLAVAGSLAASPEVQQTSPGARQTAAATAVENRQLALTAFLTNDLSLEVRAVLTVEVIPFTATSATDACSAWAEEVVLPPFSAQQTNVQVKAPAAGEQDQVERDVFVRLRMCPILAKPARLHSPIFPDPAASALDELAAALDTTRCTRTDSNAELGTGIAICSAPGVMGGSLTLDQCAAAHRLLRCSEHVLLLSELKDASLPPATVTLVDVRPAAARGALEVLLRSDHVALFVVVETSHAGVFSDNAFMLLPWEPRTITFTPRNAGEGSASSDAQTFRSSLRISWLLGNASCANAPSGTFSALAAAAPERVVSKALTAGALLALSAFMLF